MNSIEIPSPSNLLLLMVALGLTPFFILMVTSYVKLVVVIGLVKNALGTQQIPPNMVVNGLAIVLSVFIMAPTFRESYNIFQAQGVTSWNAETLLPAATKSVEPFRQFLLKHTKPKDRVFFLHHLQKTWSAEAQVGLDDHHLLVLVPAFAVAELTSAFQIGFLLFLPFIIIDLVVSNVLLAMGMMMVSPMTISLPFKLLLFVLVNGWATLFQGVILTYQ
jgi:type III secretion protein R